MRIVPVSTCNHNPTHVSAFKSARAASGVVKNVKDYVMPTVFALAMFSASTNMQAQNVSGDKIEFSSKRAKGEDLPYYLQKDAIQYSKGYESDGRKYTMYFTDYCKKFTNRKNAVAEVYFVPDDFRLLKRGASELNAPPKLEQIVYHELDGDGQNFVSVVISESVCDESGENYEHIFREIVLPQKIGEKLLDLYNGDTKYRLIKDGDLYVEVGTKDLMRPIVQRGRITLSIEQ